MSSPPDDAKKGLCIDYDPDLWFEEIVENVAKAVCRDCPIRVECGQRAIERKEEFGVWGGMSAAERRKIMTPRSRVKCPDCASPEVNQIDDHSEVCLTCGLSWRI